jgi:hypothetical protein
MSNLKNQNLILDALKGKLTAEDDLGLWEAASSVLAGEFLQRYDREAKNREWVFLVGVCSHWVRPHQTRWTAAGGFACPEGYRNFLPELDWSVIFSYKNQFWTPVQKLPGKNHVVFRIAVPARSARHKQAAVHTKWSTNQNPIFYGFRNVEGNWKCVAASDERTQGAMRETTHP